MLFRSFGAVVAVMLAGLHPLLSRVTDDGLLVVGAIGAGLKAIYEKSGTIPKTSRQIEDYMQRELIPITRSSVERFRKASEIFEKTLALKPVKNAAESEFANSISALKAAGMDREINALKANFKSHYGVDATVIGGTQIQQALIGIKKISDGMTSIAIL